MDQLSLSDIECAFKGKLWAFIPVLAKSHKIGVAVANEAGYSPVPCIMTMDCSENWTDTQKYCDQLNARRGQTKEVSLDIIASSIAQGKTCKAAKEIEVDEGNKFTTRE